MEITKQDEGPGQPVAQLFREESGKLLAALTRLFGMERIAVAEDIVQETFVAAWRTWSFGGMPENPQAWLMQVAKNKALNELKKMRAQEKNREALAREASAEKEVAQVFLDHEIKDNTLRLLFACCHPSFPVKSQIILTLRAVCGLGVKEIAAGLLMREDAVAKTLTRVKNEIRERRLPLVVPFLFQSLSRTDAVHTVIYLVFNEGYKSSSGETLIRPDLCYEAIRLAKLLAGHRLPGVHETHALLAMMYFNFARAGARTGPSGETLLLREQDRSRWDAALIAEGFHHLEHSREGDTLSRYHLEAGIASVHCSAPTFEQTDWKTIIRYYDLLLRDHGNAHYALNRAIATGNMCGPGEGLIALQAAHEQFNFTGNYLYHAALADFHFLAAAYGKAIGEYSTALQLAGAATDKQFLTSRIRSIRQLTNS